MFVTSTTSLVLSTIFLSASTIAAPTRTQCHCTIVSHAPLPAKYTPSNAHWTPSDPSPSPSTPDICYNLGAELEDFQDTKPELYESYIGQSRSSKNDDHLPIATTITLDLPARNGIQKNLHRRDYEPRPTSRPHQRIICRSEPEPFSTYQSTFVNLWALQLIIAVAILACVAEGVHLGMRWMNRRNKDCDVEDVSEKSSLRLLGTERHLLAIPTPNPVTDAVFSPGAEKKLRAYDSTRYFITQSSSGKREFIAYEEDDDDEAYRPVM
ncbi:uncharacterized protein K460DRAFT_369591 [Cucurbitaria berberidis CBS 394.84]|uniref:Uncharacterized protein n=1 Tax=Cucurbitaria berberidis CBS 394.84 TaxID=1168544 RepID=A0A9P4L428_9PLEO|nr:uncharacterized protein K460DRAFT_369591 [Cucurbitaria berberidis CBS 394.84]KAF1841581.1 hypothetical protein K460DRAFT_369591 [Cucurbitaria berberidis CBS 394.84]